MSVVDDRAEQLSPGRNHRRREAGAYEGDAVAGVNFGYEGGGDVGHEFALAARITSRTPMPIPGSSFLAGQLPLPKEIYGMGLICAWECQPPNASCNASTVTPNIAAAASKSGGGAPRHYVNHLR